jgi:hypothetical protein
LYIVALRRAFIQDMIMQCKMARRRFSIDEATVIVLCRLFCVLICLGFWLMVYKLIAKAFL